MSKLISLIVPVYNEAASLPALYGELNRLTDVLAPDFDTEYLFINDGSKDESHDVISSLAQQDSRVKYVEFSKNFGKELATSAGLTHCRGDAAIMLDADLQHPPALIPHFIERWQNGADMVIGVRANESGQSVVKRLGTHWFYKIMNAIGETQVHSQATDFRLLDRIVIDEFNRFTERTRMTRGLLDWLGFRLDFVEFTAPERRFGEPTYNTLKLYKLALSSFVSHSLLPLKLAGYLGIFITLVAGITGVFIFIEKYVLHDPLSLGFTGPATLAVFNLFLIGIVLTCLGLIAMYIGNIHIEVQNRPLYVIRKRINFEEDGHRGSHPEVQRF